MATEKSYTTGSDFPALKSNSWRLYSMRFCPYAQRARIVLLHKQIEHETININLKQKPEWFLKLAPLGLVPVIQKDDVIIYESAIVCDYLDAVYPEPKLTPEDPLRRAEDAMLLQRFSKVTTLFYKLYQGADQNLIADLLTSLDVFEVTLKQRGTPFFGGEHPMMIDFMLWPHMERLVFMGDVYPATAMKADRFPCLLAWIPKINAIPAVKATVTSPETYRQIMQANKEGKEFYDIGLEE